MNSQSRSLRVSSWNNSALDEAMEAIREYEETVELRVQQSWSSNKAILAAKVTDALRRGSFSSPQDFDYASLASCVYRRIGLVKLSRVPRSELPRVVNV